MLIVMKIILLNRVSEHDCQTFFVLLKMKCKPIDFESERFSDNFRAGRIFKPLYFNLLMFFDFKRGGCADSTVHPLVVYTSEPQMQLRVNAVDYFSIFQTSSKT